ncbi:MAG: rhodanese-like domain-containing protein [candidate division Zixibacteria bacterium]|nr:rhodanese-like domain-containing protein [candidate division Zixibacteria bacterium]
MATLLKDTILIIALSVIVAFLANALSPNGIGIKGVWYDNRHKVELAIPPSYDPKVDSLLTMEDAFSLWESKQAVFLDAREPDEYAEGHIPGAISFPFEEWEQYWDDIQKIITPEMKLVCYCGGLDCEASLDMARELKVLGYPNAYIFFGGVSKWLELKLPLEVSRETK